MAELKSEGHNIEILRTSRVNRVGSEERRLWSISHHKELWRKLERTCDGNSTKTEPRLDIQDIFH
jgi:hypothetical protein